MGKNQWQRRIDRADELAARYAVAAEILRFYAAIARFQERFSREFEHIQGQSAVAADPNPFELPLKRELARSFSSFLSVVERSAPHRLQDAARELAREIRIRTSNCWRLSGSLMERRWLRERRISLRGRFSSLMRPASGFERTCNGVARRHLSVRSANANRGWG